MLPLVLSLGLFTSSNRPICDRPASIGPFRDPAPRIERIDGGDYIVVEKDQILFGIGLINALPLEDLVQRALTSSVLARSIANGEGRPTNSSQACSRGTVPDKSTKAETQPP